MSIQPEAAQAPSHSTGTSAAALFFFCILFSVFNLFFLILQQSRFPPPEPAEEFAYLPNGVFLKGAVLAFDEMLADLLWIKTINYFGTHLDRDQDYRWLYRLLDVTTTLDPHFHDPYEFGGIILSLDLGNVDAGMEILQRGIATVSKDHPRYWYLLFFTAYNYMYYKQDYLTAAKYLEQAAAYPQSPKYLPLLVARLYANTDAPSMALPFLEGMLDRTNSPELKESLEKRIKDVQVKQHILQLSDACVHFQERNGRYPKNIEELRGSGIIGAIPTEPHGGQYRLLDACTVVSTSDADTMKLHLERPNEQPLIFLEESQ